MAASTNEPNKGKTMLMMIMKKRGRPLPQQIPSIAIDDYDKVVVVAQLPCQDQLRSRPPPQSGSRGRNETGNIWTEKEKANDSGDAGGDGKRKKRRKYERKTICQNHPTAGVVARFALATSSLVSPTVAGLRQSSLATDCSHR